MNQSGIRRDLVGIATLFLASTVLLAVVLRSCYLNVKDTTDLSTLPSLPSLHKLSFTSVLAFFQAALEAAQVFTAQHPVAPLVAHAACFIWLQVRLVTATRSSYQTTSFQAWAIPGTIFCNLLGGALFGMWIGFPLCMLYNTVGSVCLRETSSFFGQKLVYRLFPTRVQSWKAKVEMQSQQGNLFFYLLSARLFPFTPHWFINVSSPHLGVPLFVFIPTIFLGLAPYNFLTCKAGLVLLQLTSHRDIIDTSTSLQLSACALALFLGPTLVKWARSMKSRPGSPIKDE